MPRASNAYAYPYAHCGLNHHPSVTGASSPHHDPPFWAYQGTGGTPRRSPRSYRLADPRGCPVRLRKPTLVASSLNKQNLQQARLGNYL